MIILAATIIISLSNTGIIDNANKAVSETDLMQAKEIAQVAHLEGVHQGLKGEELKTYVTDYLKKAGFENKLDELVVKVTDESVNVILKKDEKPLQGISLDKTEMWLFLGEYSKLNVIYNPEDTTDDKKVTITAKVQDKEKTCNINVTSKTSISKIEDKDGNLLDASLYDISGCTNIF